MKKRISILFIFLVQVFSWAQQDSNYTNYMYNMSIVNPAYATSDFNTINTGLLYRKQWLGFSNSPINSTLFIHSAINDNNEIGGSIFYDKINFYSEKKISIDYAYVLSINKYNKLSFGAKLGINNLNIDFSNIVLESGNNSTDFTFANNTNKFYPNLGFGLFYFSKLRYIGISIPNILKSKYLDIENTAASEEIHYNFMGGYVVNINQNTKLKPSFSLNSSLNGRKNLDIALNTLLYDKVELGVSYRIDKSINFLSGFSISNNIKIGYSYDLPINNLKTSTQGTHELFILYNIQKTFQINKSPRFF